MLDVGYWRPITAIELADDDDNPDTTAGPEWKPPSGQQAARLVDSRLP